MALWGRKDDRGTETGPGTGHKAHPALGNREAGRPAVGDISAGYLSHPGRLALRLPIS